MEITPDAVMVVLKFLEVLVIPLAAWLLYSFRNVRKEIAGQAKEIATLQLETIALQGGLESCRNDLAAQPDKNALHALSLLLERLSGEIKVVNEKIEGLEAIVGRLDRVLTRQESYLLNKGNG